MYMYMYLSPAPSLSCSLYLDLSISLSTYLPIYVSMFRVNLINPMIPTGGLGSGR